MMRWLPLLFVTGLAIAALGYALLLRSENAGLREAKEKLDEFCRITALDVKQDRKDFESSDPQRREAALQRFYSGATIHHDASSFLMCLETIPSYSANCFLSDDWTCRITLAREIENALQARYGR